MTDNNDSGSDPQLQKVMEMQKQLDSFLSVVNKMAQPMEANKGKGKSGFAKNNP